MGKVVMGKGNPEEMSYNEWIAYIQTQRKKDRARDYAPRMYELLERLASYRTEEELRAILLDWEELKKKI